MQVGIWVTRYTADLDACSKQVQAKFAAALAKMTAELPRFERVDGVEICLDLFNPVADWPTRRASGSFDKQNAVFYCEAAIDYEQFVRPVWRHRVEAFADAATKAVGAIHKTRISDAERASLVVAITAAAKKTIGAKPKSLVAASDVQISLGRDGEFAGFSFSGQRQAVFDAEAATIPPELASAFAAALAAARPKAAPVDLYQRQGELLSYLRAWPMDASVVEHWGHVGERGERRDHVAASDAERTMVLAEIKARARNAGFRAIPASRWARIEIAASIDGFGDVTAIDRRHELEILLDAELKACGLGYCDGGSTGAGSMEVLCIVVDRAIARGAIARILAEQGFSEFVIQR